MTAAEEQELSHADRHDLDKLARWKSGLDGATGDDVSAFPVCAIFLVGPEHRQSHDIFRRYRSVFEELGGGFHHLVIFGQHGVSTTQVAFLEEVGMEQGNIPVLAIAPVAEASEGTKAVYCLELPKGEREGELDDSQDWGAALEAVRAAATGNSVPAWDGVAGIVAGTLRRGTLAVTVGSLLQDLGG